MPSKKRIMQTFVSSLTFLIMAGLGCTSSHSAAEKTEIPFPLSESWTVYVERFIQSDGRVIDRSAGDISTSEGQSYAMLRAVWVDDQAAFDKAYLWGRNNLNAQIRKDHLWAWKWGRAQDGSWRVLDKAFATDADQDVAFALITASKRWHNEQYLQDAREILADLWKEATLEVAGRRYLLAGDTLCNGTSCRINPSYYAPYAYRVFAKFDTARDWEQLIQTSYFVLSTASTLTQTSLPPDWLVLDSRTGKLSLPDDKGSNFSYDAFRVYWRVSLDRTLFHDRRADEYLRTSLPWLISTRKQGKLPAVISPTGAALAPYESLEMIAAILPAIDVVDPGLAQGMAQQLKTAYASGVWGDKNSYYLQNWAWFGTALHTHYLGNLGSI